MKLQTKKTDVRKPLAQEATSEHGGLEKLRGLFRKKFKFGK